MINEQITLMMQAYAARLKVIEGDNALMQAALDALKPDWRTPKGASGTMTVDETPKPEILGYVTPKGTFANIRVAPTVFSDIRGHLKTGESLAVLGGSALDRTIAPADGPAWYWLERGYVREDVVTFTPDKPATPIHAALWPAPVTNYTITNRHGDHGHNGIDFACPMGTPVRCGPNGGFVALVDPCPDCPPNGTPNVRNAQNNWGYGANVVIRYAFDILPPRIQALIPRNAFLFAQHAHLSTIAPHLKQGQTLAPYAFIGGVGSTGDSSGPHLHWELHWSEDETADFYSIRANAIDPKELIKA